MDFLKGDMLSSKFLCHQSFHITFSQQMTYKTDNFSTNLTALKVLNKHK